MDVKGIRESLIPAITTSAEGHIVAQAAERKHRVLLMIIGGILLVFGAAAGVFTLLYQRPVEVTPEVAQVAPEPPKPAPKYYSPLTGNLVADEAATKQPVTAAMIENSPDARPQSGLKEVVIAGIRDSRMPFTSI